MIIITNQYIKFVGVFIVIFCYPDILYSHVAKRIVSWYVEREEMSINYLELNLVLRYRFW